MVYQERAHDSPAEIVAWEQVKARLPEVFDKVRVKVVNSDDGSASLTSPNRWTQPESFCPRKIAL